MSGNSTTRFSNRVDDYVRYRPSYPAAIVSFLSVNYGLTDDKLIADVGAGTGISAALFLNAGYKVLAVEPNKEMREKSLQLLSSYERFIAIDGTAEDTKLEAHSIDAIIVGQAFHWFDVLKAKVEFQRVLKLSGIVALIWNERKTASSFEREYDELIVRHARDYAKVDHRNIDIERIRSFYSPHPVQLEVFANKQVFNFEGLKGRLLSSSYMPVQNDSGYQPMIADLQCLYDKYQQNDEITIHYDTKVYVGKLL